MKHLALVAASILVLACVHPSNSLAQVQIPGTDSGSSMTHVGLGEGMAPSASGVSPWLGLGIFRVQITPFQYLAIVIPSTWNEGVAVRRAAPRGLAARRSR